MVAVGLARIVLHAHWPVDVIAGFALGCACAAGAAWWDAARPPSDSVHSMGDSRMRHRMPGLLVATAITAGCTQAPVPASKPLVVASFYPLYEFSRQVAGDRAEVVSLVPPGVEPHDWEPSPSDVIQLQKAKLFVYNGAGFEPWIEKLVKEVAGKATVAVSTTERVPLVVADLRTRDDPAQGGEKKGTAPGGEAKAGPAALDPHVWLDPVLAQGQVEAIRIGFEKIDPANAATYAANARTYTATLRALHEAFEAGLRQCARRDLVVSHAAFGYLARRYRLVQVPVMGLAPEAEPSPAELAALVRFARRQKVKYIFFETLVSPKLADTLAREVGAHTLVLNPVEGLTKTEQDAGQSYVSLMEENLKHLRTALECR
jgi:zinc transport system substrate-binding protein